MIDEKKLIEDIGEYTISVYGCDINDIIAFQTNNESKSAYIVQGICEAIYFIEEQPKVGEWIPCSERLPEMHREDMEAEGEYYMISNPVIVTDGQQIYIAEYEADMDYRYGWHSLDGEDYDNIIAWMPLPKPYRPEEESE